MRLPGGETFTAPDAGCLVVIGNFDGIHRGHQAVLRRATELAEQAGLQPVVLTFDPHPAQVLGKRPVASLTSLERKAELLRRVDARLLLVVQPFDHAFSLLEPDAFAASILQQQLRARVVLVGENFRFGRERAGTTETLARLGEQHGFEVRIEGLNRVGDAVLSSSQIRRCIAAGDVAQATALLGRPHAVSGTVVRGDGLGRKLGFATANVEAVQEQLPAHGVYACLVDRFAAPEQRWLALGRGVVNVGVRPTLPGSGLRVEAHVFEFDASLYGDRLRLHWVDRVRAEQKFESLAALVAQIGRDVVTAHTMLRDCSVDPAADGAWA